MWQPLVVNSSQIDGVSLQSVLSGKIPAIIIRDFYNDKSCQTIVNKIKNCSQNNFQNGKLSHIGPFLMSYTTDKKRYFEYAKESQRTFEKIFYDVKNPIMQIYQLINNALPNYSISLASEFQNDYSPAIIRIHQQGKSIPIHSIHLAARHR